MLRQKFPRNRPKKRRLLDPRATRIVQSDDGRAHFNGHVRNLADFLGNGLRQRTAEHGEVLGVNKNLSPLHQAVPRDNAVPVHDFFVHVEIEAPVGPQAIHLYK